MFLKIGSITLQPALALAPMAGISDHPFRLLVKAFGCPLIYTEMISAKGLLYSDGRRRDLLYFTAEERPIGFQLFGSDPSIMARAAAIIEAHGADFIDLNLGCPTRKVTRNGDGGALLRRPDLCSDIFRAVTGAVSCPVTVKLRTGWDLSSITAPEIAARAEDAGIAAVTVHGRTVDQGYGGRADWEIIGLIKEKLSIPVIGNGDVDSPAAALKMVSTCGCDGVMIGRAARGNPWLMSAVRAAMLGEAPPEPPTLREVVDTALKHLQLLCAFKGERTAVREMRRHAAWYIRGLPGAACARQALNQATTATTTENILRQLAHFAEDEAIIKPDRDCHRRF